MVNYYVKLVFSMNSFFLKSLKLPSKVKISILNRRLLNKSIGYNYIWVFSVFGYIKKRIPVNIFINFKYNWLYSYSYDKSKLLSFFKMLNLIIFGLNKGFCWSLKIFGVGFKYKYIISSNWLMFKLGFSHIYRIKINLSDFRIFFSKKNFFSIYGFENQSLKNLGYRLKSFRKTNMYKFKGISFIKEVIKLKPGKKEQI